MNLLQAMFGGEQAKRAARKQLQAQEARPAMQRMYGDPINIDKVWEDRDALYDAAHSTGEKPEVYLA